MRIVIDLQGAQAGSRFRGIGRYTVSLVKAIVRNRGEHEIIIALSGLFPETIDSIRNEFDGLLPQENIRIWYAPELGANNETFIKVSELLREYFLISLNPDWLLLPTLFEPDSDKFIVRTSVANSEFPIAVFVHQIPEIKDTQAYKNKATNLQQAKLCFTAIDLPVDKQVQLLGVKVDNIRKLALAPYDLKDKYNSQSIKKIFKDLSAQLLNQEEKTSSLSLTNKPKLAYVSPLPPLQTGVADYSAELLPELEKYYQIDVIVEQDHVSDVWINENCTIHDSQWLAENANEYDHVLYHMGNSHFHLYIIDLLEIIPGITVLHDFYISGLFYQRENTGIPNALNAELYNGRGYKAVKERYAYEDDARIVRENACNTTIIQQSQGIIFHSKYSSQLLQECYVPEMNVESCVIPHLRVKYNSDRESARKQLGIKPDEFIVCSFGLLGETKRNQCLLEAWLASSLSSNKQCKLIFVGKNSEGSYGEKIVRTISRHKVKKQVLITGWTKTEEFRLYLAASDIAVQLRMASRGETSGTVLDAMNYGIPTIVNANGSMAELAKDAVWLLEDEFENSDLVSALETLWQQPEKRQELSRKAKEIITTKHAPEICGKQYRKAIENYPKTRKLGNQTLISNLVPLISNESDKYLLQVARCLSQNQANKKVVKTLFIDITATSRNDLKTGIERVARAILLQLINNPPKGYRIEPVYLAEDEGSWYYRYARNYTLSLLNCPNDWLSDDVIDAQTGDILFAGDLAGGMVVEAEKSGVYCELRNKGVSINFTVFDLLPEQCPEMFPPGANLSYAEWLKVVCKVSDKVVCISKAVADELDVWVDSNSFERVKPLNINWMHLGADLGETAPSKGMPSEAKVVLKKFNQKATLLMVGTIEPRKGHLQTIAAFEMLWQQGFDINLVIVGKEGWQDLPDEQRRTIPKIINKINKHSELNKRLFWLDGISDEYLEKVYSSSTCLIAASEGEGFGLPLIEAAQKELPMLIRDIPIFREVAGNYAYYFSGSKPVDIAEAIKKWMELYEAVKHPQSIKMPWLTWSESVENLSSLLNTPKKEVINSHVVGQLKLEKKVKKLYIDISVVYKDDFKTGIQRVARAILLSLLNEQPAGYDVVPVYITCENDLWLYRRADTYIDSENSAVTQMSSQQNDCIKPKVGDIFLGLDLAGGYVINAAKQDLYDNYRNEGVKVYFVVYDLLPITMPQFFMAGASKSFEDWLKVTAESDGVVCISKTIADDYRNWLLKNLGSIDPYFKISSFLLGADIKNSLPSVGLPDDANLILEEIKQRSSFLIVGTLEPRKGVFQVLSAFELLWIDNVNINLVFVGKEGWMVEELIQKINNHVELGKRLFWLKGISDEYLEKVYSSSTCLIAASEGEGFGLPLIEAAQHKLPIIARDIPVFREVAGEHAYYFKGKEPKALAMAIQNWLKLYKTKNHPTSGSMPWLTWRESTSQLMQIIVENE